MTTAAIHARSTTRAKLRLEARAGEILPVVSALVVMTVVFRVASNYFLAARNISNLLDEVAPLELIAVASTIVIVMGEIDLSLGSIAGCTAAVGGYLLLQTGIPWVLALVITLAAGMAITGVQALIIIVGRIRSFAVTLAGYFIWYGVQLWILGPGGQIVLRRAPLANLSSTRLPEVASIVIVAVAGAFYLAFTALFGDRGVLKGQPQPLVLLRRLGMGIVVIAALVLLVVYLQGGGGVPLVFVLCLAITVVMWLFMTRTGMGRHCYAVGGNRSAARAMGIRVGGVSFIGFAIAGALAAFAGLAIASYTGGVDTTVGSGSLILEGIGACVVGGISLLGGRGSVWGALGGAFLLAGVQNGLALLSFNYYAVDVVEGVVVLGALLVDGGLRRRLASR